MGRLIQFVCLAVGAFGLSQAMNTRKMKTLEDFGYYFNEEGQMKNVDKSGNGFIFQAYDDHASNQRHYEELGEVVEKHMYKLLEEQGGLMKIGIPLKGKPKSKGHGFIFASKDYAEREKLLLIVHGSGVVRAGQWSRRLIINNSLQQGSQLPYIKKAAELGFGVLVLNSNQDRDEDNGEKITGSESPEKHFDYVWRNIVTPCKAEHIAIVAHSYGGMITVHEAERNPKMRKRTFAVAFTDSVHGFGRYSKVDNGFMHWMQNTAVNWVSSSKELDTPLNSFDCERLSAGTSVHEETSWKAFDSVWRFIQYQYEERKKAPKSPQELVLDELTETSNGKSSFDTDDSHETSPKPLSSPEESVSSESKCAGSSKSSGKAKHQGGKKKKKKRSHKKGGKKTITDYFAKEEKKTCQTPDSPSASHSTENCQDNLPVMRKDEDQTEIQDEITIDLNPGKPDGQGAVSLPENEQTDVQDFVSLPKKEDIELTCTDDDSKTMETDAPEVKLSTPDATNEVSSPGENSIIECQNKQDSAAMDVDESQSQGEAMEESQQT